MTPREIFHEKAVLNNYLADLTKKPFIIGYNEKKNRFDIHEFEWSRGCVLTNPISHTVHLANLDISTKITLEDRLENVELLGLSGFSVGNITDRTREKINVIGCNFPVVFTSDTEKLSSCVFDDCFLRFSMWDEITHPDTQPPIKISNSKIEFVKVTDKQATPPLFLKNCHVTFNIEGLCSELVFAKSIYETSDIVINTGPYTGTFKLFNLESINCVIDFVKNSQHEPKQIVFTSSNIVHSKIKRSNVKEKSKSLIFRESKVFGMVTDGFSNINCYLTQLSNVRGDGLLCVKGAVVDIRSSVLDDSIDFVDCYFTSKHARKVLGYKSHTALFGGDSVSNILKLEFSLGIRIATRYFYILQHLHEMSVFLNSDFMEMATSLKSNVKNDYYTIDVSGISIRNTPIQEPVGAGPEVKNKERK